jgi:UDP-glucose 4-epimerase
MAVLVTGGAGYIGSATVEMLRAGGESVVVLDNLVYGHRAAVHESVPFFQGDIGDAELVTRIAREYSVDACIHFAAYAYVGESVQEPSKYFDNNTVRGLKFLDALRAANVGNIVFSSTCATYGEPQRMPLDEDHPQNPVNPYGWSKFMMERILESFDTAYGIKSVALRYFNASGALPAGEGMEARGEDHTPETHLIPLVLDVALGKREHIAVFGEDYATDDGTAVRDYIHVADLGQAHIAAIEHLRGGGSSEHINLGNGSGYSVLQVIETAREVTGKEIAVQMQPRRAGDASRLIANAERARRVLAWQPKYPDLKTIVQTAWQWHETHPDGYNDK